MSFIVKLSATLAFRKVRRDLEREIASHLRDVPVAEASDGVIYLDEDGVTPGMRSACVEPLERALSASQSVREDLWERIGLSTQAQALLRSIEEDKRDLRRSIDEAQAAIRKKHETNRRFEDAKREFERAEAQWEKTTYAQKGHRPVLGSWGLYTFIVILFMGAEFLANYEAFLAWFRTPAFAFITSIVVGALVYCAGHLHGLVIRRWEYIFREENPDEKIRREHFWFVGGGLFFLSVALTLVAYGRFKIVSAALSKMNLNDSSAIFGVIGDAASLYNQVYVSLLVNIGLYLIGILVSFATSDKNPEYVSYYVQFRRAKRAFDQLRDRMHDELRREEAKYERRLREITEVSQRSLSGPARAVETAWQNNLKEACSVSARQAARYRQALLRAAGPETVFVSECGFGIDAREYRFLPILSSFKRLQLQ